MKRLQIKWLIILLICTLIGSGIAACGNKDKGAEQKAQGERKTAKVQADEPRYRRAHYLEEEVETLQEVQHATVILQRRDAFVALQLGQNSLSEDLKNKIVGLMRATDPEINHIYLSPNKDFQTRMHQLSRDIERGTPSKEIGESFEQTIRKIFPELGRR